jgi:hypothetical protein
MQFLATTARLCHSFQTQSELMATSEFVDPRVKLENAKQKLRFMDRDGDGKVMPTGGFAYTWLGADRWGLCRSRESSSKRP